MQFKNELAAFLNEEALEMGYADFNMKNHFLKFMKINTINNSSLIFQDKN